MKHDALHIVPYALTHGMSQYSGLPDPILPDCIEIKPDFDAYLQRASRMALHGQQPLYEASQPVGLQPISEFLQLLHQQEAYQPSGKTFAFRAMHTDPQSVMPTTEQQGDIQQLWQAFETEYKKADELTGKKLETFTETLYYVLKKYSSCIPAGNQATLRGISLFEYLKLRAAIAHCLYRVDLSEEQPEFPLLLFCADISGIQSFVYDIVRSKALKALKGRSFYLQLLLDSLIQQMIDHPKIAMSIAHVVYNSGGKMYVLLPNTAEVQEELDDIQDELDEKMWTKHAGRLSINTAFVPFRYINDQLELQNEEEQTVAQSGIGGLWDALRRKTAKRKYQAFQSILSSKYDKLFKPIDEGLVENNEKNRAICAITGDLVKFEGKSKDLFNLNSVDPEAEPIYVTDTVKAHARLGSQMKNVIHYNTEFASDSSKEKGGIEVFPVNDTDHRLARAADITDEYFKHLGFEEVGLYLPSVQHSRLRLINRTDFLQAEDLIHESKEKSSYGFAFYGGNTPAFKTNDAGDPLPFRNKKGELKLGRFQEKETQQLAGELSDEDKHKGFHRLSILRMDVDNLGYLFKQGLQQVASLAGYATFSAQLDWFFGGYLTWLRDNGRSEATGDAYKDWINILYSGGDDLFLYGRWDLAVEMAKRIREDFGRFVCDRSGLSISGGLALVKPKFPFSKGAEWAGAAEKKAKEREGKDAFHLLGQTIGWGEDFDFVQTRSRQIATLMENRGLNSQFLYKLYNLHKIKQNGRKDWIWLIVYTLSQDANAARYQDVRDFIHQMKNEIFTNRREEEADKLAYRFQKAGQVFDLYVLAANLAELRLRQES